jgi:hypothetical protein
MFGVMTMDVTDLRGELRGDATSPLVIARDSAGQGTQGDLASIVSAPARPVPGGRFGETFALAKADGERHSIRIQLLAWSG